MTRKEKIAFVTKACERIKAYDEQRKIAYSCFGYDSESKFGESVAYCIEMMIDSVALVIGDKGGFFDWYVWENDFGAKKHSVCINELGFIVGDIDMLITVIEEYSKT